MTIKAVPIGMSVVQEKPTGFSLASDYGSLWFIPGGTRVGLDGDFTAQELRDLADMIDANRPFSLAGWVRWGQMVFECRSSGRVGLNRNLRWPPLHGHSGDENAFKELYTAYWPPEPISLAGWARWADVHFLAHQDGYFVWDLDGGATSGWRRIP